MAVITYEHQVTSSIPPAKMFKAAILDSDKIIPRVMPQAIKSVEIIQGEGGAGTIKKIHLGEGSSVLHIIMPAPIIFIPVGCHEHGLTE